MEEHETNELKKTSAFKVYWQMQSLKTIYGTETNPMDSDQLRWL